MGIEAYKNKVDKSKSTGGTKTSTSTSNNNTSNASTSSEKESEEDDDFYKVVSCGNDRKKIFESEQQWDETVEFIEEELQMSIDEVMNMSARKRHDILHQGILKKDDEAPMSFYPIRNCIKCDTTFVFPNNWKFVKYKGEAVCPHHTISEVSEAYEDMNELES